MSPAAPATQVLVVGSGPTGLNLACDLARRSVDVRIIDRSPEFPRSSRAKGPNPRSLEVLADLGVVDRVLAAGSAPLPMRKYRNGLPVADADPYGASRPAPDTPYDRPRLIAQWRLEEILRDRLAEYGVRVELGSEAVGLTRHADSVTVGLADGRNIGARYVVGCDGGHSPVRKMLGVTFEGRTAEDRMMVCGDVTVDGLDRGLWHQWFDEDGAVMLCPTPGTRSGWWFQAGPELDAAGAPVPPSLESFRRLLTKHTGLPGDRMSRAELLSTYRVNERMADRYRVGRVLLAGDAAHVYSVAGGLGMNTGIQDAFNLGWKLALAVAGRAAPGLLDTYEEERLPVAAWTLGLTAEQLRTVLDAVKEPGGGLDAVVTAETMGLGPDGGYPWSPLSRDTRRTAHSPAAPVTGPVTEPATGPRAGDRAPDAPCLDIATGASTHLFEVFAGPHFTLLGFGPGTAQALRAAEADHGDLLRATGVDAGARHGLNDVAGHARSAYGVERDTLVLVRPDNHIGLIAPAEDGRAVGDYLDRVVGAGPDA
ncbi:FAD-dependent monooxygenase [Streptomyces sp. NPDC001282]|uniref:FAD-dependent monooxygenase n=1 Tax=Streptomyces sp. NPDC001282 TaxID=3364557 RepID=UPI003699CDA7